MDLWCVTVSSDFFAQWSAIKASCLPLNQPLYTFAVQPLENGLPTHVAAAFLGRTAYQITGENNRIKIFVEY